ncbi:MAG: hypothetical protein LBT40_06070 [Deltaproteobacteria bacterium]|nr:hypothetical protein [Deltaproteobacteria bacterium]
MRHERHGTVRGKAEAESSEAEILEKKCLELKCRTSKAEILNAGKKKSCPERPDAPDVRN